MTLTVSHSLSVANRVWFLFHNSNNDESQSACRRFAWLRGCFVHLAACLVSFFASIACFLLAASLFASLVCLRVFVCICWFRMFALRYSFLAAFLLFSCLLALLPLLWFASPSCFVTLRAEAKKIHPRSGKKCFGKILET